MSAAPSRVARRIAIGALGLVLVVAATAEAALVEPRDGPGSPLRDGNRVLADVRFEHGANAGLDDLREAGAEIVHISRRYQTVTVAVKPADLAVLDGVARVGGVSEVTTPIVLGVDCGGLVRSEGDTQLLAPVARANIGVDGSGVTVGILSDSFDRDPAASTHAAGDVASGDLPGPGSLCGTTTPLGVLDDSHNGTDEGRAMAQVVRDLAPGAAIDFATAFNGELAFASAIRGLAAAGARVIADDVVYLEEPFFQDGPVAVAVDEVAAAGVSYFSAAGNNNVISGGSDVGSWEAPFRDAGSCPTGVPVGQEECADFDPGAGVDTLFNFTVPAKGELLLDLQWAEPRGGVGTDFDAYLIDPGGDVVASSKHRNLTATQRPYELVGVENTGASAVPVRLAISRFAGPAIPLAEGPAIKFVQLGNAVPTTAQYETSSADTIGPTVFGHAAAAGAIAVGAVRYNKTTAPESFSSRGPAKHLFGPVLSASPALAIPTQTIAKPDVVATDGGANTFFGTLSGGARRFYGTSAAAPHAAAVAALALQANPGATPTQVRTALTATARPVGAFGPSAVGAGLIDAGAAVNALALAPALAVTRAPAKLSRVSHPSFEFAANRPVTASCAIDAVSLPCGSPFTWPRRLADGRHALVVTGTDLAGRVGTSAATSFKVDTKSPRTRIVKHPPRQLLTRSRARARFKFRSSEGGKSFRCKVDRGAYRACGKRLVRRFPPGKHVLRVRARDTAGNTDPTPALFRFRVVFAG
jgi:subtilase family protein/Big-like domain-containing protein